MPESHRDVYEQWLLGMWHAPDDELDERAAALAAPGLVVHNGRRTMDERGPVALATIVRQARALFTDARVTLDVGPVVDGELVAARWSFTGRYAGGIPGAVSRPCERWPTRGGRDQRRVVSAIGAPRWRASSMRPGSSMVNTAPDGDPSR